MNGEKILSFIYLFLALGVMFIVYFPLLLGFYFYFLVPGLLEIVVVLFPAVLLVLAFRSITRAFGIGVNAKRVVLTIGLLIALIPCCFFGQIMIKNYPHSIFQRDLWINDKENRVLIVDDMLSRYKLKGMTLEEVKEVIGESTKTGYFKRPDNVVYYLGKERNPFSVDSEWLVITFDENGSVSDYCIERD